MKLTILPGSSLKGQIPITGMLTIPGDKSLSHRAALFAALAQGESKIENFQTSGVTQVMLNALTQLGVQWKIERNTLTVKGNGLSGLKPSENDIYCGNSATTIRLLAGALAAGGIPAVLTGSEGLCRRPMGRIIEPLQAMGVDILSSVNHTAPLILNSHKKSQSLKGITYQLPVASAQVKTCLILAALGSNKETLLIEPAPSRDHSERMLSSMGANIKTLTEKINNSTFYITKIFPETSLTLKPLNIFLPADLSAAAFLIVGALITPGSNLRLEGVGLNPTRTGLLDALLEMGADITVENIRESGGEPYGDIHVKSSELHGISLEGDIIVRMIDELPIFAAAAAYASGKTVVRDASELRHKESDRISSLCEELQKLGINAAEQPDGFSIQGGNSILGGSVNPHGDHRLAMTLAVAGLKAEHPTTISNAEVIHESFPNFANILTKSGASLKLED